MVLRIVHYGKFEAIIFKKENNMCINITGDR